MSRDEKGRLLDSERFHRFEEICAAALELPTSVREGFLRTACAGDDALRMEIHSLLGRESQAERFLETPAVELVVKRLAIEEEDSPGEDLSNTTLGQYRVGAEIGRGGMGVVYRAHDTKLKRDVALKVLRSSMVLGDEKRRFLREARSAASLQHSNIGVVFEIAEHEAVTFIAMELIEGESLKSQLSRGKIPIPRVLTIAGDVASALSRAHRSGIVHRDLKPANVMLTKDGRAKIIDFGLAKPATPFGDGGDGSSAARVNTREGHVLGTLPYMSPEQACGKLIDKGTDVWSFGVLLFEMLTGESPYLRDSASETVAAVLHSEPNWQKLPVGTPWLVERLLRRCLTKQSDRRLQDMADAIFELEDASASRTGMWGLPFARAGARGWLRARSWFSAAAIGIFVGLAVFGLARWLTNPSRPVTGLTRFSMELQSEYRPQGPSALANGVEVRTLTLSPDGRLLVFLGTDPDEPHRLRLYRQGLEELEASPIVGTEGAYDPFFSPDGRWIAFFSRGQLRKVSVAGGTPIAICDGIETPYGGSWGSDGTILYSDGGVLYLVREGFGPARRLSDTASQPEEGDAFYPDLLPGETQALFVGSSGAIYRISLDTGSRSRLVEQGGSPRYLSTGHIVYAHERSLFAVRFDTRRGELLESTFPIVEPLQRGYRHTGRFAVSESGALAYQVVSGGTVATGRLVLVDTSGNATALADAERAFLTPRFSPDGTRIAVAIYDEGSDRRDVWVFERDRGVFRRLTLGAGYSTDPIWSPDGETIAFAGSRTGAGSAIFTVSSDGDGEERALTPESQTMLFPRFFTRDKARLGIHRIGIFQDDIGVLPLAEDRELEVLLGERFAELQPSLSPDEQWIAYTSEESGRREVYVRDFPNGERQWQVSVDGGEAPVWAPDGYAVFYRHGLALWRVSIEAEPELVLGEPAKLFEGEFLRDPFAQDARNYDVSPDGEGFVMVRAADDGDANSQRINLVLGWARTLNR